MPPFAASVLFTIGILGVFYLDRNKKDKVSKSLWISIAWLFFCLSRSPSQWLGLSPGADTANLYVEGSPLDGAVYQALEILALCVVFARRKKVGLILRNNWPIGLFFFYAALSILWSDYSFVTLKHWVKGVGDLMMVLIVLTESNIIVAIERVFTRLAFVLLPLSVLFYKYYPQLGRLLTLSWTTEPIGVALQKNSLGELCDVLGLVLLWRLRRVFTAQNDRNRIRRILALASVLAMVVWLLWMCNSMTSICALSMAATVMFLSTRRAFLRKPARLHLLIVVFLGMIIYALFFQSSGGLIQSLGRNPTLTGRTDIWRVVASVPNHPLIGAGYESFWLGSRLQTMWNAFPGLKLNEAHNGYIEILISLGWIGDVLLGILIATNYQKIMESLRIDPDLGSLRMAFFLAAIVTGLTEAAFRMMGPPWIVFLLATAAPAYSFRKVGSQQRVRSQLPLSSEATPAECEEAPFGYPLGFNRGKGVMSLKRGA
jgi:exopolysaccharide production protein ExoQ